MNQNDFEINYWGEDFKNIHLTPRTPKRTVKQKLAIVLSFVSVLAILPITIFGITNLNLNNNPRLTSAVKAEVTPTQAPTPTPEIKVKPIETNKVEVINNDSYWKISKRTCGTGKYYLSIQEQNNEKALYKGEFVKVDCSL